MKEITKLTVHETIDKLKNKEFSAVELTEAYLENMEVGKRYNAYVTECGAQALEQAQIADKHYADGTNRFLEGIPLGVKDLFCTKNIRTTACSHILDNFIPPYESTVTKKLSIRGAKMSTWFPVGLPAALRLPLPPICVPEPPQPIQEVLFASRLLFAVV